MRNTRLFRGTSVPSQIFSNCGICLERMGISLTKKEVLKEDGADFDGIIEGVRTSSAGQVIIRLKFHGFRDMNHRWFPGMISTEVTIETFEVSENNEELPDTPNANALNKTFNKCINVYVWAAPG